MTHATPKIAMDARGLDGNVFSVLGRVRQTLRSAGMANEANEVFEKATQAKSYDEALAVCMEYVDFVFGPTGSVAKVSRDEAKNMPAGQYIISDPCYILNEEQYNNLLESGDWYGERKSTFGNGHAIWILPTKHGDGEYEGSNGRSFPVDSGTIAIIEVAPEYFKPGWNKAGMLDVAKPFTCETDKDGVMNFGNFLTIETDPEYCGECGELVSYCGGDHEEEADDDDYEDEE